MRDCPSMHAYIATGDGGYESASDVEDEYRVAANLYVEKRQLRRMVKPLIPMR